MSQEVKIGNYVLEEPIGRGGMGVVYRGRHATLPRKVAVKSISARGGRDLRRLRRRFEREAYVQSQLDHPGVVKIYDYIVAEQTYYIVMEYVEGRSLDALLERGPRPPDLERSLDLFEQILSAAAYAHSFTYRDEQGALHRGVVHRDLKPQNILVTHDGHVKVADFGIVKLVGDDPAETSGAVYGSPLYVSPEQAEGTAVDTRSDIYSLGVILYELLTGTCPFGGAGEKLSRTEILRAHVERKIRPPAELNPAVSEELQRVVCRALEKKPERRFASAYDFWRALRRARGRDADDITEPPAHVSPAPPSDASGGAPRAGETTSTPDDLLTGEGARVPRDSYLTQPIHAARCRACGAEAEEGDRRCRACGHDLTASPATAALARRELGARRSRTRLLAPLAALALVCTAFVFFAARRDGARTPDDPTPAPSTPPRPSPEVTPARLVELRPARVLVDSSFDGYDAAPLTDGVTDVRRLASARYNRANWASAETPVPHWIEVDLGRTARVAAVYVFWGFDRDRFTPSRRVELQTPDADGNWQTVSTMQPGSDFDRTAFEFAPVEASRLRIFQPAQQGPAGRPFVMWVREVQVFGAAGDS